MSPHAPRQRATGPIHLSDLADIPGAGQRGANLPDFVSECASRGIRWPALVVEQFLFDHGRNEAFVEQYDHLDLRRISWTDVRERASRLAGATFFHEFAQHVEVTTANAQWKVGQYRRIRPDAWEGTWAVPPLLMSGELRVPPQTGLHLIEGHSRLGILRGLMADGTVDSDSRHRVLLASAR